MKKLISLFITVSLFISSNYTNAQELSPFINVGDYDGNIAQTTQQVKTALQTKGFKILGEYNSKNSAKLKVIVFSRKDLQTTVLKVKDRGVLAAALKVGLKFNGTTTNISYLNPEYIFNAYLGNNYATYKTGLKTVEKDVTSALSPLGNINEGFGGSLEIKKLRKYQYKMMMPYFTDPVVLQEFESFEEGVKIIEKNLAAKKGNTKLVYKLKFSSSKVAVFGIALLDKEKGENVFLPIIGESHLAAMPYEIILQNKTATILHGRYRIALHWPELTMGTFMKIMSTPGDIEDTMKGLCKE